MNCANRYCDSYNPESTALCRICNDLAKLDRELPLYDGKDADLSGGIDWPRLLGDYSRYTTERSVQQLREYDE